MAKKTMKNESPLVIDTNVSTPALLRIDHRKVLVDHLRDIGKGPKSPGYVALLMEMSCGCKREYVKPNDVPKRSIRCKHGTWIIRYGKKAEDDE